MNPFSFITQSTATKVAAGATAAALLLGGSAAAMTLTSSDSPAPASSSTSTPAGVGSPTLTLTSPGLTSNVDVPGEPTTNTVQTIGLGQAPVPLDFSMFDPSYNSAHVLTPAVYVQSGSLPQGLTLATNGTFLGTAQTTGSSSLTLRVQLSNGTSIQHSFTLLVQGTNDDAFHIEPPTNTSQTIEVGVTPITLNFLVLDPNHHASPPPPQPTTTLTAGSLPDGVTLGQRGEFSGAPTKVGTWTPTIHVTFSDGSSLDRVLTIQVVAKGSVPGVTWPDTPTNTSQTIAVGQAPAALKATGPADMAYGEGLDASGSTMQNGLQLQSDGRFAGTALKTGTFTYDMVAYSPSTGQYVHHSFVLTVVTDLAPSFTSPEADYNQHLHRFELVKPLTVSDLAGSLITWTLDSGSLPQGISPAGGLTGAPSESGTWTVTLRATNKAGLFATHTVTLTVADPVIPVFTSVGTNTLQEKKVGDSLTALKATSSDTSALTFTLSSGDLPSGITLAKDGSFTGTLQRTGTWTTSINATNASGQVATTTLVVAVSDAAPIQPPSTMPNPAPSPPPVKITPPTFTPHPIHPTPRVLTTIGPSTAPSPGSSPGSQASADSSSPAPAPASSGDPTKVTSTGKVNSTSSSLQPIPAPSGDIPVVRTASTSSSLPFLAGGAGLLLLGGVGFVLYRRR